MMNADDRKKAVKTVQRGLMTLANAGAPLPELVPDGIYGPETKNAVSVFQGLCGLPQNGKVDQNTWDRIIELSDGVMSSRAQPKAIYPFSYCASEYKVCEGDASDLVYFIQLALRSLAGMIEGVEAQELTGVMDEQTVNNVKALQRIQNAEQTGFVDKHTWNIIADAFNHCIDRE